MKDCNLLPIEVLIRNHTFITSFKNFFTCKLGTPHIKCCLALVLHFAQHEVYCEFKLHLSKKLQGWPAGA